MNDSSPDGIIHDVDAESDTQHRVRVILKPRRAGPFFGRHPWVFESAISAVECQSGQEPEPGTAVELWSSDNQFIAHGLWNGFSNIRVRLYSWQADQPLSAELIARRIGSAVELRRRAFDLSAPTTGCRLIFSESDQLSGLTVDFYGGFLMVQFTSRALYEFRECIVQTLQTDLNPSGIWLRTEKGMREVENLDVADGLILGQEPPRPLFIEANAIRYGVDVQQGQKTGCYLDQRDNRMAVAKYLSGRRVLDAFCFSGGFGITAIKAGNATSVLGVDSSAPALTLAKANAQLNSVEDRCSYERSDVRVMLTAMADRNETFGGIILDPPKMARTRNGLTRAIKGYTKLNLAAVNVLEPGGILATCSCSGLVSRNDFLQMLSAVSRISGRFMQFLEIHGQPLDHPVSATCPETEYLKMAICRVH